MLATTLAVLLVALPLASLAQWDGQMIEDPAGLRVVNTEAPAAGEVTLETEELWRVGGLEGEMLIGVIGELLHDDQGNVYLLDGQLSEIQVVSPEGEWLRTIGREGEGPGEFRNAGDMFWLPGGQIGVTQYWPGKIVTLWPDGSPGDEFALPFRKGGSFQSASRGQGTAKGIVLSGSSWVQEEGESYSILYLKTFARDGTELASFHESKRPQGFGNGWEFKEEIYSDFQRRWTAAPDGRVAAVMDFADYRIHVWNPDGSLDRIIERPGFAPVERTDEEKEQFQLLYDRITRWNPGSTFKVSPVHQSVGQLFFRDDGTLWVQNARDQWRAPEGHFTGYDVYDPKGRFVQRVHLDLDADAVHDGVFFGGDRLYLVTDLMAAVMASFGTEGMAEDPEPISVITYAVSPLDDALTKAD
jgi:hypothetical protein